MSREWHDPVELVDFVEEHQMVADGARPVRQEPYRLPHRRFIFKSAFVCLPTFQLNIYNFTPGQLLPCPKEAVADPLSKYLQ